MDDWSLLYIVYKHAWNPQTGSFAILIAFRCTNVLIDTALKMVRKRIENVAEIRGYIKTCCKLGLSVKSIHDEICVVYGDKQMSFCTVYRLFTKFSSSQELVKDAPYSGRPRSAVTKSNISKIKSVIEKDAHFTVRQLAQLTNLGLASAHIILKKILQVTKIIARWIPHLFTNEQKCMTVQILEVS